MNETAHTPSGPLQLWAIDFDGHYRMSCSILDHSHEGNQRYVRADIADDMLAALKAISRHIDSPANFDKYINDLCDAAISKATPPEGTRT